MAALVINTRHLTMRGLDGLFPSFIFLSSLGSRELRLGAAPDVGKVELNQRSGKFPGLASCSVVCLFAALDAPIKAPLGAIEAPLVRAARSLRTAEKGSERLEERDSLPAPVIGPARLRVAET
jgi:hypothetical protein